MAKSGFFSNAGPIRDAKEAAGAQQYAGIAAMEAVDRERARAIAAEEAKAAVWGLLGQDGTFGSGSSFTEVMNPNNPDDPTSVFNTSGLGLSQPNQALAYMGPNSPGKKQLLGTPREGILDPESYARAISNTAAFRIQSQRVAESEQLLNQEGPAWDMLSNSVLGVINEGSALQLRDTVRKLKNQYAQGGTARRTAMFEANELLAGERAMRTRVQETWQANLALYDSIRQNADRVAAGTQAFMQSLPLVNDAYRDAMQKTALLQIEASKMSSAAALNAWNTKMTQQPQNFGLNFAEGIVKLAGGLALSYVTGGVAGGILSMGEGGAGFGAGFLQGGATSMAASAGIQRQTDPNTGKFLKDENGNYSYVPVGGTNFMGSTVSQMMGNPATSNQVQTNTSSPPNPNYMDAMTSALNYLNDIGDRAKNDEWRFETGD